MREINQDTIMYVKWWLKDNICKERVYSALKTYTAKIRIAEPGTRTYLAYVPACGDIPDQPPVVSRELFFVESYQDQEALDRHIKYFNEAFLDPLKDCFVTQPGDPNSPLFLLDNCQRYRPVPHAPVAGFIRPDGYKNAEITQYVKWWVKEDMDKRDVLNGLYEFFDWAKHNEPGTLVYFYTDPIKDATYPPAPEGEIFFMSAYANEEARQLHYANWNERFISKYKDYFVASANDPDVPFITVENITLLDGFIREEDWR